MIFPKVTYDIREFTRYNHWCKDCIDHLILKIDNKQAMASSLGRGMIWLSSPSKKYLLHEFLHILFWKLRAPILCHKVLHVIHAIF